MTEQIQQPGDFAWQIIFQFNETSTLKDSTLATLNPLSESVLHVVWQDCGGFMTQE